jgi:2-dehydropantoate 2-reductase
MRIAVLGAGAIGAFLGAKLSHAGSDVVLIARGAQLEALRRQGVRVRSPRGDLSAEVAATDELEAVAEADTVIVALKAHSIPPLATRLGALLRPAATTVWAQNGIPWWYFRRHGGALDGLTLQSVDPHGEIAAAIPIATTVGSVVYIAAELEQPGVVRHVEGTRCTLGTPDGAISDGCLAIADALADAGIRAPVVDDLRPEIWLKLLGNATFNPVTALTGATLGQLGELAEMQLVLLEAFREIATVAAELEIELPVSLERRLEAGIAVGDHRTSMLQDLQAGRPLEYGCLTGAVIEIAHRLAVPVPRLETLHACISLLDHRTQAARAATTANGPRMLH